jgi:NAD-dependent deacetylase
VDIDSRLVELADNALAREGPLVFLTGAGISSESGIPTFRGAEGYWKIGSTNYQPEELATYGAFTEMPEEIWAWYLYRRGVCRAARPNPAHLALVSLEKALSNRFLLVTQNVDGLHLRAGNTPERTYQIHGNIDYLRCAEEHPRIRPIPTSIPIDWARSRKLTADELRALRCCTNGRSLARPHVLWFDESYDEPLFRYESSMNAARKAAMLVVVGTSGATTLPSHLVSVAAQRGIPLVCVNPDESPFTRVTEQQPLGLVLRGTAGEWMPKVARALGVRDGA